MLSVKAKFFPTFISIQTEFGSFLVIFPKLSSWKKIENAGR